MISSKKIFSTRTIFFRAIVTLLIIGFSFSSACYGQSGYNNCGFSTCIEDYNGNHWTCTNRPSNTYPLSNNVNTICQGGCCSNCFFGGCCDSCCSSGINEAVYRQCHSRCSTCTGSSWTTQCQSCYSSYYHWIIRDRCDTYCPTYAIDSARTTTPSFTANHVGQYFPSSGNECLACDSRCNFCKSSSTNCYSCVSGYYLIDDSAQCNSRFSFTSFSLQGTCYSRDCISLVSGLCPTFYFPVSQSTANSNSPYSGWTTGASTSNLFNDPNIYYRQYNNDGICYFCNYHCKTCNGPDQTNCLTCKRFSYKWIQRLNYCDQTCPRGDFGTGWYGQYINETGGIVTSTGVGDRTCKPCNSYCRWCRYSANNCLQCRDTHFLLDLHTQCMARYIDPNNCSQCTSATYDMCRNSAYSSDKLCVSSCPTYFYFPIYRDGNTNPSYVYPTNDQNNALFAQYYNLTYPPTQSFINGTNNDQTTTQHYRRDTNLCMLCDYRCIQCTGPRNTQCSKCRNGFYKWTNNTVCDNYCPIGQYIARDQPLPVNQTECANCHGNCLTCQKSNINCSSCVGADYAFYSSNGNVAFLYAFNDSYAQCMNTCPQMVSPDYQTRIGFYGSFLTLTCYPCPSPCSNCNIQIIRNNYPYITCELDPFCSTGLVCTNCLLGYVVVGGKCIAENNCRQYSYYDQPAVSTSWSAVNCKCLDGYSSNSFAKCDIRCHISCQTCTGTASNQCSSCYRGSKLVSGSCVQNTTQSNDIATWIIGDANTNVYPSGTKTCGSYSGLFGYEQTSPTVDKYFGYTISISSLDYYAINIKMGLLFVDQFNPRGAIYIRRDSNTSGPAWSWNYNTKNAYGQQLCGTNKMDYVLFATAEIPTRNLSSQTFYITSNENLIQNNLGPGYQLHWGIYGVYITVLKCHSTCSRCSGPNSNNCIVCSTTGYIPINGICDCDIDLNYYKWADGICRSGCPNNAGWFRDNYTRSCVQPPTTSNCTAPYRFGDTMGTSGYGWCVADCGATYYASMKVMKCTTDCWASSLNQYKFDGGASRTCQDPCPVGYIKDVLNRKCVLKCPGSYYYQMENSTTDATCVSTCPSGWQYDGLQLCVTNCPSGYFRQVSSSHNKCVSQCTNAFGDPDSGNCTLSCPFPKYADPETKMCVDTCSNTSYLMQVAVSNTNRTCVTQCEAGQWANPFTKKCSNYTTDCPDGYYADSSTRFCQPNCTVAGYVAENSTKQCRTSCLTGFAHWESRTCVQICPSIPVMFGYKANKTCLYTCDYAVSGLYGDAQANRTCVQKCSSSSTPTFGQNSTSLCVVNCSGSTEYGDEADIYRRCVAKCSSVPRRYANPISKQCVITCPDSYFGQIDATLNSGVCVKTCLAPNFGDPDTNWCRPTCKWGFFGLPIGNRLCVQTCPRYWFGINATTNRLCVQTCDTGYWGDIETSMCYNVKTSCSNDTYADAQKKLCVVNTNCTLATFADPFTKGCQVSCSNNYYADSNIRTCVQTCSDSYDQYGQWGVCRYNCIMDRFADPQANRTCVRYCSRSPLALFGVIATRRVCVTAANCPINFYGDNNTLTCVNPCTGTLPYGDPVSKQCVVDCPDGYYGDINSHLCVQICNFTTLHYADNRTGNCETLCTLGTFGVNASAFDSIPSCQQECPPGSFARDTDRICVANCGSGLYGDPITRKCFASPFNCSEGYFANSVSNLCVLPSNCQTVGTHYFAQNQTKTCVQKCSSPNYGDSLYWSCNPVCNETSFGQNTTRLCKTSCAAYSSYAQTQNNLCVARCSNTPIKHYSENVNYTCVEAKDCPVDTSQTYAQNSSQSCVRFCGANQWADPTTFRCVAVCPNGYYADDSTGKNLCSTNCPGYYRYRDNSTRSCVSVCPESNQTFGDPNGDSCVYRCPAGSFAQVDANRTCVPVCAVATWGNKQTRICITNPLTQCPTYTWADNFTQKCEQVCDSSSGYYGYNATRMCVTSCPSPTFAWDGTRICIDICPASLTNSGYFGDPLTTPTRKCFLTCQTSGYYRDVAARRTCVTTCTYNSTYKTYKDPTTMSCEAVCSSYPQYRYADDTLKSCETSCAGTLKKNDATQRCEASCPYLYDPTTDKCVDICPTESVNGTLFANITNNNNTCVTAANCPVNTFADFDSRVCVSTCPQGTYKSGKYCVYICPSEQFMDNQTQSCVAPVNCSSGLIADNQTRSCVRQCIGTFAQSTINRCIDVCYGSKYGDPFTRKCQLSCSQGLRINTNTRTCEADCVIGLYANPATNSCTSYCSSPYYADNNTMSCLISCSANPMTFASVSNSTGARQCVGRCQPTKMHDMVNRICVDNASCPTNTYSYALNMSCVSFCPAPSYYQLEKACVTNCSTHATLKYADDITRKCVSSCPSGTYKDGVNYKCVSVCPTAPVQYYVSITEGKCTTFCPEGTYADPADKVCVAACSLSPPLFAEEVNNVCVSTCPAALNSFADLTTGKCVNSCPSGYFADSRDRTCKQNCTYLFADSGVNPKACVSNCSANLYADQLSFRCVSTCPTNYYKYTPTRQCVKFCPHGYFLNAALSLCVVRANCPSTAPYADNLTHLCASVCSGGQLGYLQTGTTTGGECKFYCPLGYFSNPLTGKCVTACPDGLYADTDNNTCSDSCTYEKFMDSVNNKCVTQCSATSNLFANTYNRTCVTECDPDTFTYADILTRKCQQTCTGNQFADDLTQKCVGPTSCSSGLFSDPNLKRCVDICSKGLYGYNGRCIPDCPTAADDVYGSHQGFVCVTQENCPNGTYADPVLHLCVEFCPIESDNFADQSTRKCLSTCNSPLFADNLTRKCVEACPNVSKMYGDTQSHKCVLNCPYPKLADQTTNLCQPSCPFGYFSDFSTLSCVKKCPEGMYANNVTNQCQITCPSSPDAYFGDPETRECVLYCPQGKYADADNNRQCQTKCIGNSNTYAENSTNACVSTCLTGFANSRTKQCIAVCTAGFYGYNKVCYQNCPSVSPTVFADNKTHLCVERCPNGTFADYSTLKCVKICPVSDGTFGDADNWVCTSECIGDYFADTSTRMCVRTCPRVPALFGKLPDHTCVSQCSFGFYADNSTRKCQTGCPLGTYADNITMKCESKCPTKPFMYGENITNKCVFQCWPDRNMFADNATGTCVYYCTPGTFADTTTRMCVQTCPQGYFAQNRTGTCEEGCEPGAFADSLSRICVAQCPINPIFYGDPLDHICKSQCPTGSFGNPLNQQCQYDSYGISTCPNQYFGDSISKLCVLVCPKKFDLYGDPYLNKCGSGCTNNLVADNSTMRCVARCPQYPSYFANLDSMRCIPFCPAGTFADQFTRTCVSNCPNSTYADRSTWRCVTQCPYKPLTFGFDGTWQCLSSCPNGTYSDNSTLKCVPRCPVGQNTFAENGTNKCVRVCSEGSYGDFQSGFCVSRCYGGRFSDNLSKLCLQQCPKYPPLYADSTTDSCVTRCPSSYYSYEDNRTCVQVCPLPDLYRQNTTASCVKKCNYQENTYADNFTGYCVSRCSVDSWADPTIRVCVAVCPDQPLLYSDNATQTCVQRCPGSTFGQNSTRSCVNTCPTGSLSLPQKNLCVRYCPIGYFAYNSTAFCFDVCPGNYYGDPSTRSCVLTCPLNQLLYADNSSRQCVKTCPPLSYADKKSVSCVGVCPLPDPSIGQRQTFAADYNNVCVQQCQLPYYAYLPTKTCVSLCPNPYYNDIKDHICKLCPNVCLSCSIYDVCTTCIPNHYLENGKCVPVCSQGYYAQTNTMKCVSSSLCKPKYGVNDTHFCESNCAVGTYKNNQVYRCDACQTQCLTCSSWTYCLSCENTTSIMHQNYCYLFCERNDTNANGILERNYSPDNRTCFSSCPKGTYLFVIFCKNCSSTCETCFGNQNNCTRCSNGMYLQNGTCVSSCSSGYKPVATRDCIFCGSNCGTSLTFQTNMTQINGQNTIYVTFNSNITLNGDPNSIFGITTSTRRRLLQGYRIVVIDERTVQIILDNGYNASNVNFQINQPENIQDIYGNIPAKVRDDIIIDLSNTYTETIQTAPSGFSTYSTILAAGCVIAFLFDIQLMKFMQLIYVHYFVVMILPPQLSKVLLSFRYSTLSYLPKMYNVPTAVLRQTFTGKIFDAVGDYSFLRNAGFALTPLAVIVFVWILLKILSVPEINRFKSIRVWCKEQLDEKFKLSAQIEWLSIVFVNTIFFCFLQMKDYNRYDQFCTASIVISDIVLAIFVLVIIYIIYRVISFFREYPRLSSSLKKATDVLLQENEYHRLNTGNIFLYQMKKIDLRNLYYPKVNNENILPFRCIYRFGFLPLCCLVVTYLRGTILSLIIVFSPSTLVQMSLCIPLNVLCLLYFCKARPYSFKFQKRRVRNYIAIYHEVCLIIFELLMLALGILDRDMKSSSQKGAFSKYIIYYLCVICSASFIYTLFRVGVQIYRRVWQPFTATELFKTNFPNKYAEIYGEKKDKLIKGVDPKAKQALRTLIKGYKKNRSALRPTQQDKANPQLPIKYKITYFDRDSSSVGTRSSMTKSQKRKMLKQIFQEENGEEAKNSKVSEILEEYEEVIASEKTEAEYEQYEQQIEIKASDLAKYVKNAEQLLKLKKMKEDQQQ